MNGRALKRLNTSITTGYGSFFGSTISRGKPTPTRLDNYISPLAFQRLSHDIGMWRESIFEAESDFFPMRVKMQRMYMDTKINGYVKAVYERWRELTIQRDYAVYNLKGGKKVESIDLTQAISEQSWMADYIVYLLEAIEDGYSMISMGDIINDSFPNISSLRKEHIRPDGRQGSINSPILTSMVYSIDGIETNDGGLIEMCNHWIKTRPSRGSTNCGYGLNYEVSLFEIHLRHILEWNVDFVESYAQPIKIGKTRKIGKERKNFENFLRNGTSSQWALLDKATEDEIEYKMATDAGTAWKSYENLEKRLEGKIAQLVLGHENAIQETAGKLGGMQAANKDGFNESLTELAMSAKQTAAGDFVCRKINEILAPNLRKLGKYVKSNIITNLIPEGYYFGLKNDKEEAKQNRTRNAQWFILSQVAKNLNDAGLDVNPVQYGKIMDLELTPSIPTTEMIQVRDTTTTKLEPGDKPDHSKVEDRAKTVEPE